MACPLLTTRSDVDPALDIIPFPIAGPPPRSTIFPTQAESDSARKGLTYLNQEAKSHGPTAAKLQKVLQDLKELLNDQNLTE